MTVYNFTSDDALRAFKKNELIEFSSQFAKVATVTFWRRFVIEENRLGTLSDAEAKKSPRSRYAHLSVLMQLEEADVSLMISLVRLAHWPIYYITKYAYNNRFHVQSFALSFFRNEPLVQEKLFQFPFQHDQQLIKFFEECVVHEGMAQSESMLPIINRMLKLMVEKSLVCDKLCMIYLVLILCRHTHRLANEHRTLMLRISRSTALLNRLLEYVCCDYTSSTRKSCRIIIETECIKPSDQFLYAPEIMEKRRQLVKQGLDVLQLHPKNTHLLMHLLTTLPGATYCREAVKCVICLNEFPMGMLSVKLWRCVFGSNDHHMCSPCMLDYINTPKPNKTNAMQSTSQNTFRPRLNACPVCIDKNYMVLY